MKNNLNSSTTQVGIQQTWSLHSTRSQLCRWITGTILGVFLLLLVPTAARAQYIYTTNSGAITITGYTGGGGAVIIPGTINSLPVTSIGGSAFQGANLTSVTIPANVTNIGSYAFADCYNLTTITVDPLNVFFRSVAGVVFDSSQTTLLIYPGSKGGSYTITNSVTKIGDGGFAGCTNLISVTFPSSVTNIGNFAFDGCNSLTNFTLPTHVTSIGASAFRYCFSLTGVTIPASVTSIGGDAFLACQNLTAITVDPLNAFYSSGAGVLFNKNQTTLLEYPAGKVGGYTVPAGVTSIAGSAFESCSSLASVVIPDSVTTIAFQAFYSCSSLSNVTIGRGVTSIGTSAFSSCSSLTGIYFLGNTPTLGDPNVFYSDPVATIYYLAGTTMWGPTFGGLPTAPSAIITGLVNPSGDGVVSGGGLYPSGTNAQLAVTANGCWAFTGWSDGNLQNPRPITVPPTNITYTAIFTQLSYPVGTSSSPSIGGTTSGGGTLLCGSNVTVHATNTAPYQFIDWTENGLVVSTNADYSFTVTSNRNLVAQFDRPPTVSGLLAITNALLMISNRIVIVAGETNVFSVGAADPDGNALTYRWIFGDGITSAWSAVALATHAYTSSNCGPYNASVTVSDGYLTYSSNLAVVAACELTITKLQVGLNFAKANADSIALTGKLHLPGVTNVTQLAGVPIVIGVGGGQVPFTLDQKGRGASASGTCRLAYTKPTRTKASVWTVTISLSKGNWQAPLAAYGLTNETISKPARGVTVPAGVLITNEVFAAESMLHYTARHNQTGTAK